MIPKIIHYCWFGKGPMPELAVKCIESWHKYMPDWEYVLWNEDNFDVSSYPYTQEAYNAKKYAFVSDVARLVALKKFGGVYFDVDFEVFKPYDGRSWFCPRRGMGLPAVEPVSRPTFHRRWAPGFND